MPGVLISSLACKKLRNHHSVLTSIKLNPQKKSVTLLRSSREMKSLGKPLPPKLERQTGRYRESQLARAEPGKLKPPQEAVKSLNYT
jgi:hypothetical protein